MHQPRRHFWLKIQSLPVWAFARPRCHIMRSLRLAVTIGPERPAGQGAVGAGPRPAAKREGAKDDATKRQRDEEAS